MQSFEGSGKNVLPSTKWEVPIKEQELLKKYNLDNKGFLGIEALEEMAGITPLLVRNRELTNRSLYIFNSQTQTATLIEYKGVSKFESGGLGRENKEGYQPNISLYKTKSTVGLRMKLVGESYKLYALERIDGKYPEVGEIEF